MKLQNLTIIFIIIMLPIILLVSFYISTGLKTIRYQALYDTGLLTATQDAVEAFEKNTLKNSFSDNAEAKRSIIKASIKMFEASLCNTCNISVYNTAEIEEYIPAMVFGMSDGFYMYAPSYNPVTEEYEHSLKNYVYYSEMLNEDKAVVIRYYLDSYVQVSGYFDGTTYESKEGYLINIAETKFNGTSSLVEAQNFYEAYQIALNDGNDSTDPKDTGTITYYGKEIDVADELAVNYFVDNYKFSHWFLEDRKIQNYASSDYLKITAENDPEDPNSEYTKHKNKIIREKIEGVLNSTITAYSERTWGQNYKMPKLSDADWEKVYTDISLLTFFQGKKIGFTKYNGYCVINSNNHYELINPNLLYFVTDDAGETGDTPDRKINTSYDNYHDIRCSHIVDTTSIEEDSTGITTIRGWRIGRFDEREYSYVDDAGIEQTEYNHERKECACYDCINGTNNSGNIGTSIYDYIAVADDVGSALPFIKRSYWTSLARERAKLHEDKTIPSDITITKEVTGTHTFDGKPYVINGGIATYKITVTNGAEKIEWIEINDDVLGTDDRIENIEISTYQIGSINYSPETFEFGVPIELRAKETLEVIYKANVSDKDHNQQVTNEATVTFGGEIKTSSATCYTIESKIEVTKEINTMTPVVEYGDVVEYTITVENKSTITDNICIKDIYNEEEIQVISIDKVKGKEAETIVDLGRRYNTTVE